ncbi:MAG: Alpha N-terminal protein methyltransferase 1 [Vezdaea acicularis]|nr:MAG: Alpha N-terminal protein methyltransferase 1 [Vezdaea acicularis]
MDPQTDPNERISQDAGIEYWTSISADINGMLGGFPEISLVDLRGSRSFVAKLRRLHPFTPKTFQYAVDCGAGIGRITKGLLTKISERVDIVEPVERFTSVYESDEMFQQLKEQGKIGIVYKTGLQDWVPKENYDLIWNQWCLGHLTDSQLVMYLERCRQVLKSEGWIIVKENISTNEDGSDEFDEVDSSVTRLVQYFCHVLGLQLM